MSTVIELQQVTVAAGGETILYRCTAILPSATITRLVGGRGAGKTTLVRAIAAIQPHSGTIRFDGADAAGVRSRLYVCFDDAPVFPFLSGYENVRMLVGRPLSRSVIGGVARDLADHALLTMPARQLSHGQRQRLHLVAALASGASYLILDDIFSGIGAPTPADVSAALARCAPSATVLITGRSDELLGERGIPGATTHHIDLVKGTLVALGYPGFTAGKI
jgi:ABC-type multidrug transport system ATPase subunit